MNAPGAASWCAVLTASGRGAVAVVAAGGPIALEAASRQFRAAGRRASPLPAPGEAALGRWGGPPGEELMLLRRDDELEVHCHGGRAAVRLIVADFVNAGCELIRWQEHLNRRAGDLLDAEAFAAAAFAATERAASLLLAAPASLRAELATIESAAGHGDWEESVRRLTILTSSYEFGSRLQRGWSAAVTGAPNVGKSSLVNALLGYERAIVYDEPGVTRDVLRTQTAVDGWPVELIDAAGLRDSSDPLEAEGIAKARAAAASADVVVEVLDATDAAITRQLADAAQQMRRQKLLVVVNKIDLAPRVEIDSPAIAVSAATGDGLESLQERIAEAIAAPGGAPSTFLWTERQRLAADRAQRSARNRNVDEFRQALDNWRRPSRASEREELG